MQLGRGIGRWLLMALPLVLGGSLRLLGIRHGEPDLIYHPDVPKQTLMAQAMYAGRNDPRDLYRHDYRRTLYPYGTAFLVSRLARVYSAVTGDRAVPNWHQWQWALQMRYFSTVIFLLAVWIVTRTQLKRLGASAAILAGLLLVVDPANSQFSHYGMNDVPLTAMLLMSWVGAGLMPREKASFPVVSFLTGAAIGIGFGIKYQALLGAIFPAAVLVSFLHRRGWVWGVASAVALTLGAILGVLFSCPLVAASPTHFIDVFPAFMRWQAGIMEQNIPLPEKVTRNVGALALLLFRSGGWLPVAGGIWGTHRVLKARPSDREGITAALSAMAFCLTLTAGIIVARDMVRANDIVPLNGFMAILFAGGLAIPGASVKSRSRQVAFLLAGAAAVFLFTVALKDSLALARIDTRARARDWAREHLPAGATILRESYTLPVHKDGPAAAYSRFLASPGVRGALRKGRYDYLLASSLAHSRFYDRTSPYYDQDARSCYETIRERYKVLAVFEDRPLYFAHPRIVIYARDRGADSPATGAGPEEGILPSPVGE